MSDVTINDTINIRIPRWTREQVSLIDLLLDFVVEVRQWEPGECDLYTPSGDHLLRRIGTIEGLKKADLDLFDADKRMFWEMHASKLNNDIIQEIATIRDPNWHPRSSIGE